MHVFEHSLASLKKRLAEAKALKAASSTTGNDENVTSGLPIEADRFLTPEDFERIKYATVLRHLAECKIRQSSVSFVLLHHCMLCARLPI